MRVFNFSAGPAVLPEEVLLQVQQELLDYQGKGMSVMEMSHRSAPFQEIIDKAEACLRDLMGIPDNYQVLFLQGGASSQFSMIPLNLFRQSGKADFLDTGAWAVKAIAEARRYGVPRIVASSFEQSYRSIPDWKDDAWDPTADYAHITTNNTIAGTLMPRIPNTANVPLVADMSSNILSQEYEVAQFGIIYAGAQKNIGPAGLTLVIIREDLIGHALPITPKMFNYQTHAEKGSMFNTPSTFAIYVAGLVFDWINRQGGVSAVEQVNREKAKILYDFLDQSSCFYPHVHGADRSLMNVTFSLADESLNASFLQASTSAGLVGLKGHRSVGGMRASLYNAMPLAGLKALVEFMKTFEEKRGH
ncbi:MAG: 3-phosphoserine/phosphohydroxythreonine transaminase [Bacteroidota bacterium]